MTNPLPLGAANRLSAGFAFVEGPVWLSDEEVFVFSDLLPATGPERVQPSRIQQIAATGGPASLRLADAGTNGLALAADGSVLGCSHAEQAVVSLDLNSGERRVLADRFEGERFNSPNDLAVSRDGSIYFSDPDWQRGLRTSETGRTGVYRIAADGEVSLVDGSLNKPNGVVLSPDGRTLYVSAYDGVIRRYAVADDGSTGPAEQHAEVMQPDGMSADCAGNLYVASASGDLWVFAPSGEAWGSVRIAAGLTNVAFGGSDAKLLLATAGTGVYALSVSLPGLPY